MNALTVTGRLADESARRDTSHALLCQLRLAIDAEEVAS